MHPIHAHFPPAALVSQRDSLNDAADSEVIVYVVRPTHSSSNASSNGNTVVSSPLHALVNFDVFPLSSDDDDSRATPISFTSASTTALSSGKQSLAELVREQRHDEHLSHQRQQALMQDQLQQRQFVEVAPSRPWKASKVSGIGSRNAAAEKFALQRWMESCSLSNSSFGDGSETKISDNFFGCAPKLFLDSSGVPDRTAAQYCSRDLFACDDNVQ